jgi:hypothetical protein
MKIAKVVILTAVLLVLGVFYKRFKRKLDEENALSDYDIVKQFLLNDSSLATSTRPIIWIHSEHAPNARNWESFYSRMSNKVNQPYRLLAIKSIIDTCGDSFNISLIDDSTFGKIIPGWTIDLSIVGDPLKSHLRQLAMTKILYYYGGLVLPSSFVALQDLYDVYESNTSDGKMLTAEVVNRTIGHVSASVIPTISFLGCQKDSEHCKALIDEQESLVSQDQTDASNFLGVTNVWLHNAAKRGNAHVIPGQLVGTVDKDGNPIGIEELLGQTEVLVNRRCYGILIPGEELLLRSTYKWFVRMSPSQVVGSNTFIGKMLLAALSTKKN